MFIGGVRVESIFQEVLSVKRVEGNQRGISNQLRTIIVIISSIYGMQLIININY